MLPLRNDSACVLQSSLEPVFCSWVHNCVIDSDGAWHWTDCTGAWEVFVTVSPLHHAPLVAGSFSKNWLAILVPLSWTAYHQLWSNSVLFFSKSEVKKKKPPPTSLTNALQSISHASQTFKRRLVHGWLFRATLCWWPRAFVPCS